MFDSIERCRKYYERSYLKLQNSGLSADAAIEECAHGYLDGKPQKKGAHADRSKAFWSCSFWGTASAECYRSEAVVLALERTLHFKAADRTLVKRIGSASPECLMQAIKYSQIFLQSDSVAWLYFVELAESVPESYGDFFSVCTYLRETVESMEQAIIEKQRPLEELTVFEVLLYGSIYTFKILADIDIHTTNSEDDFGELFHDTSDTLGHILFWKLKTRPENDLKLSERFLGRSLKKHLSPLLFPEEYSTKSTLNNLKAFDELAYAVQRLNRFHLTAIKIFCYDDDLQWSYEDGRLAFSEVYPDKEPDWDRNGRKLKALQMYWMMRALHVCETINLEDKPFGKPENEAFNREAYLKAMQTFLQLDEIYGLGDQFEFENGTSVNLFRVLQSMELMSVFFKVEHLTTFQLAYKECGNWMQALQGLFLSGMPDMQNRLPLTWAEPDVKARDIVSWTSSDEYPEGNVAHARAILDFWSSDLNKVSARLKSGSCQIIPELYEKPILRIGRFGLQLPWLIAAQNNSIAVINNLRRIGKKRAARIDETHRIEARLGELFEARGFAVVKSFQPELKNGTDAGEVDLLCFLEGHLFILEVKSGYYRRNIQDAWIHKTNTLRKASRQLERKRSTIIDAVRKDIDLRLKLRIPDSDTPTQVHAWIVDTSIEYDQSYINGFLKVSLEGLRIILRDEQQYLNGDLFSGFLRGEPPLRQTLYPKGFTAEVFSEIVEKGNLWSFLDDGSLFQRHV